MLLAIVCLGVVAGCKADATVTVDVKSGGSGVVTVEVVADKAATDRLDLHKSVVTDDLKQAGWKLGAPEDAPGGGVRLTASKPFANPDELRLVLDEVGGKNGIFKDIKLETETRTFSETAHITGRIDLTKGIESYGDEDIKKAAGGSAVGVDPKAIETEAKTPAGHAVNLTLVVKMPNDLKATNAPSGLKGGPATWKAGSGQVTAIDATSEYTRTGRIVVLVVAVALLLGLVAAVTWTRMQVLAKRRARPKRASAIVPGHRRVAGNKRQAGGRGGGPTVGPGSPKGLDRPPEDDWPVTPRTGSGRHRK